MISDSLLDSLATAISKKTQLSEFPAGISVADAYPCLPLLTQRVSGSSAGIKAGITNVDLQKLFGLEEALIGLLYQNGEIRSGSNLPYSPHRRIECEMAVTFDAQGNPIAVGPAVEFVSLDFSRPEDMTPGNVTLCNLGADQFICGDMRDWVASILTRFLHLKSWQPAMARHCSQPHRWIPSADQDLRMHGAWQKPTNWATRCLNTAFCWRELTAPRSPASRVNTRFILAIWDRSNSRSRAHSAH